MSCCGQKRTAEYPRSSYHTYYAQQPQTITQQGAGRKTEVCFEYTGNIGLTVSGTISGRRYRFESTGSLICADPKDIPALRAIPQLREIRR